MALKENAREVLQIVDQGYYNADGARIIIETEIGFAITNSCLYEPEELALLRQVSSSQERLDVEVTDGTTQQVALELSQTQSVGLLNFASARNPGGGFLNGAKAQEEDLCRCSTLFPTLEIHKQYYEQNRRQDSMLYTDHMIYSPNVPFFKTRGTGDFLKSPFLASVITAPAPNTRPYLARKGDPGELEKCFLRRWQNVVVVARDQNVETLLLGAWGCGAFGGDPFLAASTARSAIELYGGGVGKIVFAIPGKGKQSKRNLDVFREQLG